MTSIASAPLLHLVELTTVVADLREAFGALVVAEAAMLDIGRKLDVALAGGSDATPLLAELEHQAERHAAAAKVLRELSSSIGRALGGDQKSPSESVDVTLAQAGA